MGPIMWTRPILLTSWGIAILIVLVVLPAVLPL